MGNPIRSTMNMNLWFQGFMNTTMTKPRIERFVEPHQLWHRREFSKKICFFGSVALVTSVHVLTTNERTQWNNKKITNSRMNQILWYFPLPSHSSSNTAFFFYSFLFFNYFSLLLFYRCCRLQIRHVLRSITSAVIDPEKPKPIGQC